MILALAKEAATRIFYGQTLEEHVDETDTLV